MLTKEKSLKVSGVNDDVDSLVRGCLKSQNKCDREGACLWHDRPLGALRGLAKARALRSRHLRTAIAIEKEPRSKEKLSSR
ncbi:MAG: hypothetical protein F6J98_39045 [Moorea sp. SIO4G2]|nr:hypothetical protein [Moorena sp. SIO4G2]